jgi:hypothetical protein
MEVPSASQATSRDALEAPAVGIQPVCTVRTAFGSTGGRPADPIVIIVASESRWAASDARLEIRYRSGGNDQHTRERLDANEPPWEVNVPRAHVSGSDGFDDFRQRIASVVLAYSDVRNIARYRQMIETTDGPGVPLAPIGQFSRIR